MAQSGFDTVLPADSIEFCPHPDAQEYFVCGTYMLHQNERPSESEGESSSTAPSIPQKRTGKCLLFKLKVDHPEELCVLSYKNR